MAVSGLLRLSLRRAVLTPGQPTKSRPMLLQFRCLHLDHRQRLSNIWTPPPQVRVGEAKENEESHEKLLRAGFFRKAHSGIFHILPLGLRVQDKVEAVVDKHMKAIGASRVSLSSISSAKLWSKSGRLETSKAELLQFKDRKDTEYLLAPTHEEEITELVAQKYHLISRPPSPSLPNELIALADEANHEARKYRDEMRPRFGILRSREFLMKDLYSFDVSAEDAMVTYDRVREAYAKIFAELNVPILTARASSGDMGGDLSHEYHLAGSLGEDDVAHCRHCDFAANVEIMHPELEEASSTSGQPRAKGVQVWRGLSNDKQQLVNVWYPAATVDLKTGAETALTEADVDVQRISEVLPELNLGLQNAASHWDAVLSAAGKNEQKPRLINLVDGRLRDLVSKEAKTINHSHGQTSAEDGSSQPAAESLSVKTHLANSETGHSFNFLKPRSGDRCPDCGTEGGLVVDRTIELGHTFYLGTRYSEPMGLRLSSADASKGPLVPVMGCYGIGVSRILGAVADHMADAGGLHWPRAMAPYEVVVASMPKEAFSSAAESVYDMLSDKTGIDVVLDDRGVTLPWKLKDADLVGYPVTVVVGKSWTKSAHAADPLDRTVEVQSRRLGFRQDVPLRDLQTVVEGLLAKL